MNYIQVFFIHAFVIVVALWLMFGLFCGITSMPNTDMSPQFKSGDLLLFYRLGKDVKSQDVVVVKKNDTIYVGRVVAVPGDTVEITDDERLIINGNAVIEHNISGSTPRYEGFVEYPVTLGDREYFILGDARAGAEDSRYFGKVDSKEIMGVVITMIRRSNI
ncbi:MAG: signal peptidase I [Lachnospiraceae bacterium]|nr:signal peptidase I [Lachnospiraceae bacterium]